MFSIILRLPIQMSAIFAFNQTCNQRVTIKLNQCVIKIYTFAKEDFFGFSAILLSISFDTRHRTGLHCQTFKLIINMRQNFQLIIFFDCFFSMNAVGVTFWTETITSQTQSKNECSSSSSNHQICEEFFVSTQNSLWQLLCLRS